MFALAGYAPLNVLVVHRVLFLTEDEVAQARNKSALKDYPFLSPMNMQQLSEHVAKAGKDNVLLVPIHPELPEKEDKQSNE